MSRRERRHGVRNPVFDHELLSHRRVFRKLGPVPAVHWLAGLVLAALYVLVVAEIGYGVSRHVDDDHYARMIVTNVTGWTLFAVLLAAPGVMAPTLVNERLRGSWDLLRLTRLSPLSIVLGKYFGRMMLPADLMLLAAVPVAIGLAAMEPDEAFGALLGTVGSWGTALLGFSALGLWASARARHAAGAVGLAYGLGVALVLGVPIVEILLVELLASGLYDGPVVGGLCSPLVAWISLVAEPYHDWDEAYVVTSLCQPLVWAVASVGLLASAVRHMTYQSADEARWWFSRRAG